MNHQEFDTVVMALALLHTMRLTASTRLARGSPLSTNVPMEEPALCADVSRRKYLVSNAETVAMASHLVGRGIVAGPKTDWQSLQVLKNAFLDGRSEAEVKGWQEAGVTPFRGRAVMSGEDEVTVGHDRLKAHHIVLATGATPRRSEISGAEHIRDSDHFLNLPDLPNRIVFIGGGYISFEFAHVAIHAGAKKVTILDRSSQPLKAFDQDIVKIVLKASEAEGIRVVLNESPRSVESAENGLVLQGLGGGLRGRSRHRSNGAGSEPKCFRRRPGKVKSSLHGVIVNDFSRAFPIRGSMPLAIVLRPSICWPLWPMRKEKQPPAISSKAISRRSIIPSYQAWSSLSRASDRLD